MVTHTVCEIFRQVGGVANNHENVHGFCKIYVLQEFVCIRGTYVYAHQDQFASYPDVQRASMISTLQLLVNM